MSDLSWVSEFEAYAAEIQDKTGVPGFSVSVSRHGETIYEQGFGYRDLEQELAPDGETIFGIGSITKSFTALALLILEQEGKLSTGDLVTKWLPGFKLPGQLNAGAITIHHFLTHTSGLAPQSLLYYAFLPSQEGDPSMEVYEEMGLLDQLGDEPPINTYAELMERLADSPIRQLGRPGMQFSYSNDAYALLGAIIEEASGESYETFVADRILAPLGMERSGFDISALQAMGNVTQLYDGQPASERGVYLAPTWVEAPAMVAAGFLRSTVRDMQKYGQFYLNRGECDGVRLLEPEQVGRMTAPYFQLEQTMGYGYGLVHQVNYHGNTLIEHSGGIKGVAAQWGIVPEQGLSVSVLSNLSGMHASQIWLGAINLLLGLEPRTKRLAFGDPIDLPAVLLREYAGHYRSGEGADITVGFADGTLMAAVDGQRMTLVPVAVDRLKILEPDGDDGGVMEAVRGPGGTITAMRLGSRIIPRVFEAPGPPAKDSAEDEE